MKKFKISLCFISVIFMVVLFQRCEKSLEKAEPELRKLPLPILGALVKDVDGNKYHTVTIGTQTWMVENLNVVHFRNGDPIPSSGNEITAYYNNYENDRRISRTYGKLYSWQTIIDPRNIAPVGWHIPSDAEWNTLINYLGGESIAGGKLKEAGTAHWLSPNVGATNESGFTALPGGDFSGWAGGSYFEAIGVMGWWWTSTGSFSDQLNSYIVSVRGMSANSAAVLNSFTYTYVPVLNSIRCIKD